MADEQNEQTSARDNSDGRAPLLPGGDPEQSGTGPRGPMGYDEDGNVVDLGADLGNEGAANPGTRDGNKR